MLVLLFSPPPSRLQPTLAQLTPCSSPTSGHAQPAVDDWGSRPVPPLCSSAGSPSAWPSSEGEPTGTQSPLHPRPFLFVFPSSHSDNWWLQFAPPAIVARPLSSLSSPIKGTHTFSALHRTIPLSSLISSSLVCHPQQGAPPTGGHHHRPVNSATAQPPFAHDENPCVPLMLPKSSCRGLRSKASQELKLRQARRSLQPRSTVDRATLWVYELKDLVHGFFPNENNS
jgi:hypothetical protein